MVAAEAKEALYGKPAELSKETIRTILELLVSWNGDTESIDVVDLPAAADYINEYLNEN